MELLPDGALGSGIPANPGTYCLHLWLERERTIPIGRLGEFVFPAGHYFYCGSARGSGGLRGRLLRHLRERKRVRWHVDYLAAAAVVRGFGYARGAASLECAWSQALASLPGARIPVSAFGAGDCSLGCPAHLVWLPGSPVAGKLGAPDVENRLKLGELEVWRIV